MLSVDLVHGHYRPDMVTRTAVVDPYNVEQYSPVDVARQTAQVFSTAVRGNGPTLSGGLGTAGPVLTASGPDFGQQVVDAARRIPYMDPMIVPQGANVTVNLQALPMPSAGAGMTIERQLAPNAQPYRKLSLTERLGQNLLRREGFWSRIFGGQRVVRSMYPDMNLPYGISVK